MTDSLRKKYILSGLTLIIFFLLLMIGFSRLLKESLVEQWNRSRMEHLAQKTIQELDKQDWDISKEDMDAIAFEGNAYITVVDENMKILVATRNWEASREYLSPMTYETIQRDQETLEKTGSSFSSNFDENNKASFVQINKVPNRGYVIIRKSVTGLNSSMRVMEICSVIAACITLLCGIPVIIYLSGRMVKPIREINKVTERIAGLDFEEMVPVTSRDELGRLAESVNTMSDKLKDAMEGLQKDVELRNELVRNMAHELKTPVTVVMGYAENMPYIAQKHPEKLEKYCAVIADECERMDSIIQQMLQASLYEYGESSMNREVFSSQKLFQGIRRFLNSDYPDWEGSWEEKDEICGEIWGDYEMLRRGIYNFVKNAVRYGKKNGRICIRAWEEENRFHFSVFNEGEPIPEEEQEKIWNVFYKVNTARTRERGSFGIGLSIAKQAARSHGGDVDVKNVPGGVEFGLYIKKEGL
ncbi:MAG TPA: HAMP domain-containing histidine kinase [Candidatus Blautia faecigallinarum]|uniref:histidine kinase n=1 Tax=Candidatus Blautia faecigallinarum TaxID=2838488 RepID=A0A9D2DTX6_9FIRM|nr:HAMP domain-containing histidine kinase [Candidatus Blautia faecigallinarum]